MLLYIHNKKYGQNKLNLYIPILYIIENMKGLVYKMSKLIDLTGQKFGRLTVIKKDDNRKSSNGSYWLC